MKFNSTKLRVKELSEALSQETEDVIAVCAILGIQANSPLTSLSIEECKRVTDYYESI